MFSTNIKLAFRNLIRFKSYTALNVAGLAIGLALGIFAILYIRYEFGYDSMHVNRDRMYKLLAFTKQNDQTSYSSFNHPAILGDALKQEVSEIETYSRYSYTSLFIKKENEPIAESGLFADENFFQFFNFEVKEGNVSTMLREPGTIALSETLAQKLFGDKPAVGQMVSTLLNNQLVPFKVSGVFKDVEHSTIRFSFVIPLEQFLASNLWANDLKSATCDIMFLLKQNTNIASVNTRIKDYMNSRDKSSNRDLFMQPLSEFNLYHYQNGTRQMGKLLIVLVLSVIAVLILAISSFNFINMAIAIGVKRYREAGIKKIMGSTKKAIVFQFLTESVIICLIALFFAFILLETILPFYNRMDNINLTIEYGSLSQMLLFIGFASSVGIIAALYPAVLLSSTSPIKILRGNVGSQRIGFSRQGLIVFQFFITIVIIVGLFVYGKQASYINSKDIGLNRYNVIFFTAPNSILEHREAFLSELYSIPEVSSVSWSSQNPIGTYNSTNEVNWEGKQANEKMDFWTVNTDPNFMNTMKVRLASGRFFSEGNASDSGAYVLNEEAVKSMHLTDPLGKTITVNNQRGTVVGIVNNYHSLQLMTPYLPVILSNRPSEAKMVFVRFSGYKDSFYKKLEKLYKKYEVYVPFTPKLMEDSFREINIFANNAAMVLSALTVLAIFLSCLGLFGLASFTIETRTKEIGIRKVNGASTLSILRMFLKSYNKWIIIASCVALPLAFLLWNSMLGAMFAFRIQFPVWALLATPVIVMLVAWSTVIWQSWKAASKNPVEALRYE